MSGDKSHLKFQGIGTGRPWPDWREATVDHKRVIRKWYESGESSTVIAEKIGVNQETVLNWLKRLKVDIRSRSKATHLSKTNTFYWTERQLEVLEGELLGDGCLQKYARRPLGDYYFVLNTSSKEHALHLKKVLPEGLFAVNSPWISKNGYWNLKSRSSPKLTELRRKWYPKDRKIVPRDLEITPTVCHYWHVGDGCLGRPGKGYCARFSTQGFDEESVKRLREKLIGKGFKAGIWGTGADIKNGAGLEIFISMKDTLKFLNWIKKPKIQDYEYKWA